jgi:hypothetical protein
MHRPIIGHIQQYVGTGASRSTADRGRIPANTPPRTSIHILGSHTRHRNLGAAPRCVEKDIPVRPNFNESTNERIQVCLTTTSDHTNTVDVQSHGQSLSGLTCTKTILLLARYSSEGSKRAAKDLLKRGVNDILEGDGVTVAQDGLRHAFAIHWR